MKRVASILLSIAIIAGIVWWISSQESVPRGARWPYGQVHWHATLQITTCGEFRSLTNIGSQTNHVGNTLLHTHGDNLYHLEGSPTYTSETTLGAFFDAIGVPFSDTSIFKYKNGDVCTNGTAGLMRMTVNGLSIDNLTGYAPKDKDSIAITFG